MKLAIIVILAFLRHRRANQIETLEVFSAILSLAKLRGELRACLNSRPLHDFDLQFGYCLPRCCSVPHAPNNNNKLFRASSLVCSSHASKGAVTTLDPGAFYPRTQPTPSEVQKGSRSLSNFPIAVVSHCASSSKSDFLYDLKNDGQDGGLAAGKGALVPIRRTSSSP